ncbi:substrate-binding domain-containing protein [Micromonospora sp. WMMD1102]|uniref:VWA domain-containing protein n=1 Tax=Micromonospora sp. WMMD1102 TaxID=3016105 RepID=UPI00241593A5|nr:VWA domain-containing protein [Micromonospora sp. WMMD1102]MDG4789522.1 substrate-binding domain-containing protein [Micromonospora sp. WMMD1102]
MRRSIRGAGAVASAMALVLVAVGGWYGYQQWAGSDCSGELELTVAAAPEIAPAIQKTADALSADQTEVDGLCVAVEVTASESVDVAAAVAGQHGVSLSGVGQPSGSAVLPNVWLPDSSTWLLRLRQQAPAFAPQNNASVARSPVVVAMPEPLASTVGWPEKKLGWKDLLGRITTGTQLKTGLVEPSRDAAGLAGLVSLATAAQTSGAQAQQKTTAALRALATGVSAVREELIARFPRATDPTSLARGLGAAALSEVDVIEFNAKKPPVPLAALYLEPAPLSLDYPYAVMPGIEPARASAAEKLFAALDSGAFRGRLAGQGLRAPDGTWADGFAPPRGAPSPAGTQPPPTTAAPNPGGTAGGGDGATIERVLSSWAVATQSGRMLAIVDISGSMSRKVPTANNATRMQVTLEAARRGLALFDDSWALGLWVFSTELSGSRDYRSLVPIGPMSAQREELEAKIATITPKKLGDTGLFDTILAGYKAVQEDWQPGRVNSVVMLTDGKNEDDNGISQAALLAELKRISDPDRPVQVIIIGISAEVSKAELDSIPKVTGGAAFVTEDPAKIGDIFLQAIAARREAPPR